MKTFTIFYMTKYGLAIRKIKASTMLKAYLKLPMKVKLTDGFIIDENELSFSFNQILGLEETI